MNQDNATQAAGSSAPACSASFTIIAKGPGVHRHFKGTADVKEGSPTAALILLAMLNQIITQDKLTGDTNITAKLVIKSNTPLRSKP